VLIEGPETDWPLAKVVLDDILLNE
jgi:hypothetical protein